MNWVKKETTIEGCFLVTPPKYSDNRGAFSETYKDSTFQELGLPKMVQDNLLLTAPGGVRAMHWQEGEHSQSKLVLVTSGEIFDAVFDLRRDSKTFGKFETFKLNTNSPLLFVPKGCAHGFQSMTDSIVCYKTDIEFHSESQRAFLWNDPKIAIPWPVENAIVSEKDAAAPVFSEAIKDV
jgi:dTDP-4-dehydrorhamnose 3,5-epimerase